MRPGVLAHAFILLLAAASASAQNAVVSGRVVAEADGQPLASARVVITGARDGAGTFTDTAGLFSLPTAPLPQYPLAITKPGYAPLEAEAAAGAPIELRLRRAAAIVGRVVDDAGEPVISARVSVARADGGADVGLAFTDDRGAYRLSVAPGEPLEVAVTTVSVILDARQIEPGVTSLAPRTSRRVFAEVLTLRPAEERSGVDFRIPLAEAARQPFSAIGQMPVGVAPRGGAVRPDEAGRVEGRVLDPSGRGLPFAQVALRGGGGSRATRADAAGRFSFADVMPGGMSIAASKSGYALVQQRVTAFSTAERREVIDLELEPRGAINGRVLDELREPIEGARVQLLEVQYQAGRRRLVAAGEVLEARSDDRGEFRLFGIAPGQYVVSASVGQVATANLPGFARSYHPGVPTPVNARFVAVEAGRDLQAVDVIMVRGATFRVAGRVLDAGGQPRAGGNLQMYPSFTGSGVASVSVNARMTADGSFEFPNVAPGQYVIQAYRGRTGAGAEGEFGAVRVAVADRDVTGLLLQTSTGSTIAGRVVLDPLAASRTVPGAGIEVSPVPADFDTAPSRNWANAPVAADGRFLISGVSGPRRLLVTRLPPGWRVVAVRANGTDVTDRPIAFGAARQSITNVEVVLTDIVPVVSGRISDARGRPRAGVAVVAFPRQRDRWFPFAPYFGRTSTAADGTFRIEGLPPGGYYVTPLASLPDGGDDAWQDPALLDTLAARAASAVLGESGGVSVTLPSP
ncbi:MAG: carboxypeptidase regulatory-like domain-containing protein [Vicinamibacterales bacterium]